MAIDKIFSNDSVDGIADNLFNSVSNSVSEVKAMQQRKAAENVQLVIQSLRKIENDLRAEYGDVADKLSERIAEIKNGQDGRNGSDGRAGKDGRAGRDGLNGKKGEDGLPGADGIDGIDGVSVTDASIDFDGSLVITLSNGRVINVGEVVSQELANNIKVISTMSTNGAVGIKDEGTSVSTGVKNINFVGASVTATASGDDVTVNVSAGTGTVTSVAVSGGTTGLTTSGGPITTSGTITLAGTLATANGGTGNATGTATINANLTGDVTSVGNASTLATVNTNVGSFTAANITVNAKGLITAAANGTAAAGGSNTQVQYNNAGVLAGITGATTNGTALTLTAPVLGTPASGTVTNLTGTASININGTVGATTPAAGAFTTGTFSSTLGVTGVATLGNGAILGTPASGTVTNLTGTASININGTVGATTPAAGAFTTLSASGATTLATTLVVTAASNSLGVVINGRSSDGLGAMYFYANNGTTNYATITTSASEFRHSAVPAAAVQTFYTNASERMRIDTSGNVGIGVSPSYQLQVNTDSAGKPGVGGLWTVVSDERIKSNIVPANLDRCYEIVKSVPLKHFGFAPGVYTDDQIQDKHNLGWIAQDVQKVFKNAVSVKPFTLKIDIPDGVEEYEEQDFTLESVEKTETSIQVINGKAVQVSKVVPSKNKVMLFDTVDVLDEAGVAVMDGDKPLTYQMPRMITKTRPKVRHDVIEDCLDLNSGQMIAALYGCVQALMAKVEALEAKA